MVLDDLLKGLKGLLGKDEMQVRCPRCKNELPVSALKGECPYCHLFLPNFFKVKCPKCGKEISADSRMCEHCGFNFSKRTYRCPRCGYSADYYMTECPSCGVKFA